MAEIENHPSKTDWPSVLQMGLSLAATAILWGLAATLAVAGLVQYFGGQTPGGDGLALLLMSAGLALSGALLLPSAGFALARLAGRRVTTTPASLRLLRPTLLILLLPLVLLLGYWVSSIEALAWLFLPALHLLAIGLPVWWLVYLGMRGLPAGTPQRQWGVFDSGLVLGPALILLAELAVLLFFLVLAAAWLGRDPQLTSQLSLLLQRLSQGQASQEELLQLLGPYLTRPEVIAAVFVFAALLVPLIEEALKPIGVWLLASRSLTPVEGFTAGLLSGAGYALFESLALASGGDQWAALVFARIGTAGIHILTTGLTGWALVLAWRQRRFLRLAATYVFVVFVHGLWNALTLVVSIDSLAQALGKQDSLPFFVQAGRIAPYLLAALALASLFGLLWLNYRMRQKLESASPAPVQV
jgi:hypothetical protein